MKNPDKACTVFVMSSNYPRFSGDICGWFIHEISRRIKQKKYRVIVLSPHARNSVVHEVMDGVDVNRFLYFYPARFEKLAYGSGILYNLIRSPIAFFNIVPFFISELICAGKIVHQYNVKMIHTHWLIPQGFAGAVFHRIWNIPHVATVHGSDLNIITRYKILAPVGRFIIRNSDIITINSTYMKRQLESFAPESSAKIRVIPMGIDPEKFKATEFIDIKKKFETGHLIISVGRLIDWKGTIHLINAMPAVFRQFPDAVLLIIGAGPEKETLVNRAQELGLENRIHFPGVVDNEDLPSYYHEADVFVLPSINISGKTEALGVVLLEAMVSGCPVIGSNVGGIPDIIVDGENGFLVPEQRPDILAEKIVQLLSDDGLREQFRKNCLIRVREKFSWEKISKDFSDVFDLVLTNHIKK